jgi:hypothetical protein
MRNEHVLHTNSNHSVHHLNELPLLAVANTLAGAQRFSELSIWPE